MKPEKMTPAHTTEYFAELCCSNSLRGAGLENAVGLLKEELRRLDSLILQCADATRVEAGGALAVDRHGFAKLVTEKIRSHPNITVIPGEVTELPEGEVRGKRCKSCWGCTAISTSLMRRRRWCLLRAWIWNTPGWVPGMIRARTIM